MIDQADLLGPILNEPEPVKTIPVEIEPKGLRYLLVKCGLAKPRTRTVELIYTYSTMHTFQRITELMSRIKTESQADSPHMDLYNANAPILAAVIATALHNNSKPVPSELVDAIMKHFTNDELHKTAQKVYRGLDYTPFYNTMELLLSLRPNDTPETTVQTPLSETPKLPTN